MNTHEIKLLRGVSFNFNHELDGFTNPFHELVERAGLGVAAGECGHCCHKEALGVALYNNGELA